MMTSIVKINEPRMNCDIGFEPAMLPGRASGRKLIYPNDTPTEPIAKMVVRTVSARNASVCNVKPMRVIALPNKPPRFLEIQT